MSLSRTGNPEVLREGRFGAADGASDTFSRVTLPAGDGGPVVIPDEALLRDGEFLRQGGDLVIRGSDGAEVVVQGYFAAGTRPTLATPGGDVALSPGLVDSFLSAMAPGQYAQTAGPVQSPIGQVDELKGEAFAVRADGTRVQLATGDPVFEGDIVETGGGTSAIRMVFVDKTMFALGSDARLALDELVFDPSQSSGSSQFSILKGVFIFSSGQIAKTDNTEMTVVTPVAAIGIRGTEVAGRVDGANSQFTLIDGAIEVTTQAGSVTLDGAGETTLVAGIDAVPSAPFVLSAAEYGVAYGGITGVAPNFFTTGGQAAGDTGFEDAGLPDLGSESDDDQARDLDGAGSDPATSQLTEARAPDVGIPDASAHDPILDLAREISETVEHQLAAALTLEPSSEPGALQGETDDAGAGGDSPYRTETADLDVFWNPYVLSEPYGTIQFTTDSDDTDAASGEVASSAQGAGVEDNGYAETPDPQPEAVESGGNVVVPPPSPAAIVLTVSNAIDTTDLASQDRTNSFELVDDGPNSSSTVLGSVMALPGVAADAAVYVARDAAGNVDVELTTAWNSIKNIYAVSDQAADIAITNFVHADLDFGNGGDSHIVLDAVKRGFINTGDGDDVVDIKAFTNIDALSRRVDVKTGDGDDMVIYEGSSSYLGTSTVGLSELTFTAGAGTDTLKLTGPDQVFDLTTARFDLTGIEHFDISAAPNATLKLDANIVSTLVGSGLNELTGTADTLVVSGVAGDRLDLANGGSWSAAGTVGVAGESYTIYEHGSGVRIAADQDITLV